MTNLVIIYGPPASGKLTISQIVAPMIDACLLHNHAINDFVQQFFPYGTEAFFKLSDVIRVELVRETLNSGRSAIVTVVHSGSVGDRDLIQHLSQTACGAGACVRYVKLVCSREELKKRVVLEERSQYKKLRDSRILESLLDTYPFADPILDKQSLVVDTGCYTPQESADLIVSLVAD